FEPVLGQYVAEPLARAVAPTGDDHVQPPLAQGPHMRDSGVEHVGGLVLPFGSEIAACPAAAIDGVARVRRRLEWGEPREWARGEPLLPLVFAEIEPRGGQRLVVG